MTTYIVAFDPVDEAGRQRMRETLKSSFPSYGPIHRYCWAIRSDKTATEIRAIISAAVPAATKLIVIRSGVEAAWRGAYGVKNDEWLKKHL